MTRVFAPGAGALLVLGVGAYTLATVGSSAGGLDVREACNHLVTGVWGEDHRRFDPLQVEHRPHRRRRPEWPRFDIRSGERQSWA